MQLEGLQLAFAEAAYVAFAFFTDRSEYLWSFFASGVIVFQADHVKDLLTGDFKIIEHDEIAKRVFYMD